MKYETILFDFDGTLLYTIPDLADAVNFALRKFGCPERSYDEVQSFVGNGVRMLMTRSMPLGQDNPDFEMAFEAFQDYYGAHCQDKTRPYDGVMQMLAELKARGAKMAIVTNKYQTAAEELRQLFFGEYIDLIVGDIEGRPRKPAKEPVIAALKALGADASGAVYIGDTEVDMQTAQNSGLNFIAAGWGYRTNAELRACGAAIIAQEPRDVLGLV